MFNGGILFYFVCNLNCPLTNCALIDFPLLRQIPGHCKGKGRCLVLTAEIRSMFGQLQGLMAQGKSHAEEICSHHGGQEVQGEWRSLSEIARSMIHPPDKSHHGT